MKLKELRKNKGLTQDELASSLNIQQQTYGKYELNKREPDIQTLCKIADYYGVSLDYLCEHKTEQLADFGVITPAQKMAISILLKLPESNFYEYLGRLKTTADLLNIQY